MRCTNCRSEDMAAWQGDHHARIGQVDVTVPAAGRRCARCGESYFSTPQMAAIESAIAAALVEAGARSGEAFRFLRKEAGLKAKDVADLLDVTPDTVSRWERGVISVPRAAMAVVGAMATGAEVRGILARLLGPEPSEATPPPARRDELTADRWRDIARQVEERLR